MRKRKLTPDEERAYRALARAASKLRKAQERAEQQRAEEGARKARGGKEVAK